MNSIIKYDEAVKILVEKINDSHKRTREIAEESGVSYDIVSLIKNNYKKPFPKSVEKLFKYFGIEATQVIGFEIKKKTTDK